MRPITWVLLPPALVAGIVVAVANRTPVRFSFDPFRPADPILAIDLPLYLVVFAALAVGIVLGGFAAWLSAGRTRRTARERKREIRRLHRVAPIGPEAPSETPRTAGTLPATR